MSRSFAAFASSFVAHALVLALAMGLDPPARPGRPELLPIEIVAGSGAALEGEAPAGADATPAESEPPSRGGGARPRGPDESIGQLPDGRDESLPARPEGAPQAPVHESIGEATDTDPAPVEESVAEVEDSLDDPKEVDASIRQLPDSPAEAEPKDEEAPSPGEATGLADGSFSGGGSKEGGIVVARGDGAAATAGGGAATVGAGAGPSAAGGAQSHASLLAHLRRATDRCYPRAALARALEGVVDVHLCVDGEGRPHDLRIEKKSRSRLLDRAALECVVKGSAPLPRIGRCVVVPIRFSIRD